MEATLFAETMRTEEQFHEMTFPRLLALAERAWYKSEWEDESDESERETKMENDWDMFTDVLGYKELPRLEKMGVKYLVSPPGAR